MEAMKNPNTMAPEPQGFSGSEWAARGIGKGVQGLGKGLQSYNDQNAQLRQPRGGGMDMGMMNAGGPSPQPFMDASQNALTQATDTMQRFKPMRGNNLNFYGGS